MAEGEMRTKLIAALSRRPDRATLLPGLAALAGVVIAGGALLRAPPATVTVVPPGYVALVNQKGILQSDFITQTATETAKEFEQTSPAERHTVLREMIDEELLVQRGLALDLPETTTEVRETMATAVTRQAAEPQLAQPLTDAELRAYYQQHRGDYETDGSMTLRDLVLHFGGYQNIDQSAAQAETDAAEAVYRLRSGDSPDYIIEHFGFVDSGRVYDGEQLEFAAKLRLGPKLYPVARMMTDGQISDAIPDTDGIHVLVMQRRLAPHPVGFDAARDRVYTALRAAQAKLSSQQNLQLLRRDAQILLAPGQSE
jgi:hypothetical protein